MRIGVIEYPGSSADYLIRLLKHRLGYDAYSIWHDSEELNKPDVLILPGGAAFADYLRPGALAKTSLVAGRIRRFAMDGGPILGIGNGFQILCELGILTGALLPNSDLHFCSREGYFLVENNESPFTGSLKKGAILKLPLRCSYGRFWADSRIYQELEDNANVVLRFCDENGETSKESNFVGALDNIAAITNRSKTVLGMIARPDYSAEEIIGGTAGLCFLEQISLGKPPS